MKRRRTFDRGAWLLQRQRLHIADEEPPPGGGPAPIGDDVRRFLKSVGLHGELWRQSLQTHWKEIVGEGLADRTRPGEIRGQTLLVFVRHSIYLHELARNRAAGELLVSRVRERLPDAPIRAVRFAMDPGDHDGP